MTNDSTSRLTLLASPTGEALTLAEAKQFLRIEHDADDAAITRAIVAARLAAQEYLRVLLLPQTYSYECSQASHILPLPVGPAQSISEINVYDRDGNATEVNPAHYRLTMDGYGVVFVHVPQGASLVIEFSAGLADVPATIKQGMLHHIASMLEQRDGAGVLPSQSRQLCQPLRRVRL